VRPHGVGAGAVVALVLAVGLLGLMALDGGMASSLWEGLLYLLPALLLLLVLLARRYPGERLVQALRIRRTRLAARVCAAGRRIELAIPSGGRLIAVSLAGRAPPLPRAGACGLL
jgi:hypothetical protein